MDKNSYTGRDEHMEVKRQLGKLVRKTNRQGEMVLNTEMPLTLPCLVLALFLPNLANALHGSSQTNISYEA